MNHKANTEAVVVTMSGLEKLFAGAIFRGYISGSFYFLVNGKPMRFVVLVG